MKRERECGWCFEKTAEFYCCCTQVFLCENCVKWHIDDLAFELPIDLSQPLTWKSNKDRVDSGIDKLKLEIKEEYDEFFQKIVSGKLNLARGQNVIHMSLQVNSSNLAHVIEDKFVYLCNDHWEIVKVGLGNWSCWLTGLRIEKSLKHPFWLLEWKQNLILLGGRIGFASNKNVWILDLETEKMRVLTELPSKLECFCPVIDQDQLYVVGGCWFPPFSKSVNVNEVLVFDLNSGELINRLSMNYSRIKIAACVFNSNLLVMSENCPNSIELKNLNTDDRFTNLGTNAQVTNGSFLMSFENQLFLFNFEGVFRCNDLATMQFDKFASFLEYKNEIEAGGWNTTRGPCVHKEKIYFFGKKKVLCVDLKGAVQIFRLNYNDKF